MGERLATKRPGKLVFRGLKNGFTPPLLKVKGTINLWYDIILEVLKANVSKAENNTMVSVPVIFPCCVFVLAFYFSGYFLLAPSKTRGGVFCSPLVSA
ncbi:MAG: hypothetical protein QW461_01885 [Candidatus Jordarchaeales archaeon]